MFFLAQFLQNGLGYGPLRDRPAADAVDGHAFFVAPVAGALVNRVGERPLMVGGLLLQAHRHGLDRR